MSSEVPPNPITNVFNEKDWIHTASGSSSSSTNAINTNITATDADGTFYPTFVSATSGYRPQLVDSGMTYNPSTNTLTVGTLIGATSGTVTNAVTSQNVVVASGSSNTDYFPTFVSAATRASLPILTDSSLKYNPFTDTLYAGTFNGTVSGSIATATTADNVKIAQGTVNTDYFPTFVTATGSSLPEYIDPNLKYNPVQDILSVPNLVVSGTLTASVSTATTASNVNVVSASASADHFPTFVTAVSGASLQEYADSELKYNPATNLLTVPNLTVSNTLTATVGSATNATNIVVTDSTTQGTTAYPVFVDGAGATGAKIDSTGMSYNPLNNTLSVANLSGTATNASNIGVLPTAAASNHYLTMVDGTTGNKVPYTDAELTYNPSTNVMSVPSLTVSGTLTATVGSATNSTNATNAANIAVATVATDTDFYPTFVGSTTGNVAPKVDTGLRYNPYTNTLTADTFVGTVSNAATASTATGITVTFASADVDFNPIFVANSGPGVTPVTDIEIKYNPSTNLLTVPNLTVSNTLTGTVANATNATNMNVNNYTTSAGSFYPTFVAGTGNASSGLDTELQYTPSNNTLSVVNLTASGTITGTFGGTIADATNAANVYVTPTSTASNFYPTFVSTNTAGNKQEFLDTELTYNPNTNTLTAVNITATGTLSGTFGGTIDNATNAANVYVTPTSTASNFYPTFVSTNTAGNKQEFLDTELTYNPSTNTLTATNVATTTVTATNVASTSTTGTLAIGSNLTTGGTLTLGNTGCSVSLTGKQPSLNYAYPASSPSQLGWSQLLRSDFNVTYGTVKRTYGCNTTALVAGIYSIRYFVYIGDGFLPAGQRLVLTLVANPTSMTNGGTTYTDTGSWAGYSINNSVAFNIVPTVCTGSFIFDNTGTISTSSVYPFWAVTVECSANSGSESYWDTYFVRIA